MFGLGFRFPQLAAGGLSLAAQIRELFADGEQGGMWDFTNPEGLYQDAAGTTPVTALGQPVGLVLDRRFGLERGPELVTNGKFDQGLIGWTGAAIPSYGPSTVFEITEDGWLRAGVPPESEDYASISLSEPITVKPETHYEVSFKIRNAGARVDFRVGPSLGSGTYVSRANVNSLLGRPADGWRWVFKTGATTSLFIQWIVNHAAPTAEFNNISIRELPGNPLSQATTTARPTYTEDGALHDGVDDRIQAANAGDWAFLHDGTGGFMGASSIYLGEAGNSFGYYGTQTAPASTIGITQGQQSADLARSNTRLAGDGGVLPLPSSSTGSVPNGVVASEMLQHANSHVVRWVNGVEVGDTPYDGFVPSANAPSQAITTHVGYSNQSLARRRMLAINRPLTDPEIALVNAWLREGVE